MGLTTETTNLLYARQELIKVGESFIFDKVADMIYYMLANDDVSTASTVAQTIVTTDADGGGYGLKITNTFTKVGASAHKALWSDVTYTPASTGTACPIAIAGKVSLNGNLTYANSYPGCGWGVQGQIHIVTGTTLDDTVANYDPGAVYAAVRGVTTDAGTSTYTDGTITSLYAETQISQAAATGTFRVFLAWLRCQGSGTSTDIDAALYIDSGNAWGNNITVGVDINDCVTGIDIGTCTTGINISGTCTTAINVSGVQTDSGGLDVTAVFQHGTWSTPLVYGAMDGHTVFRSVSITASSDSYIMGDLFKLTTTASSTGTLVGHYNYITVAHTTASTYVYYGRLVMSTDATITNAECMLLTVNVNSGVTLGTTGHLSGLHVAMTIDAAATDIATAVETIGVYVQTSGIAKDVTGNTIGIKVEKGGGSNFLDYGLQFSNQFENCTAVEHFQLTQGNVAIAMKIETGEHTTTSAITLDGKVLYCFDFDNADEGYGFEKTTSEKTGSVVGLMLVKDQDGSKAYINVYG